MGPIDVVRVVVIVEGLFSAVLSAMSLTYFLRRSPVKKLVSHVQRVTLTYFSFVIYGCIDVALRFGDPSRWQPFALLVVFSIAASAQVPLMRFERDTERKARGL